MIMSFLKSHIGCPNMWGPGCTNYCTCRTQTTTCDAATGCQECVAGFRGGACDQEIDECSEQPDICGLHANCTNTFGSYICTCWVGYKMLNTACIGKLKLLYLYMYSSHLLYIYAFTLSSYKG